MEILGVYSGFHKNIEASAAFLHDMKESNVLITPMMREKKATEEEKSFQECLYEVSGMSIKDLTWGRVVQKGQIPGADEVPGTDLDGRNDARMGADVLLCAFAELPTAVELFQKARNMDWRNVEERTFATGGKIFDFTV